MDDLKQDTTDTKHVPDEAKRAAGLAGAPGSGKSCCWVKDEYGHKCGRSATWWAPHWQQPYCDHHAEQMRKLQCAVVPLSPNAERSHSRENL